jgi:WD40 repeat protein
VEFGVTGPRLGGRISWHSNGHVLHATIHRCLVPSVTRATLPFLSHDSCAAMITRSAIRRITFSLLSLAVSGMSLGAAQEELPETVSYYENVRPIFQVKCQGCHQPARAKSGYIITEVASLIAGGENSAAVVPGKPAESSLIEQVTKLDGDDRPAMPLEGDPLTPHELSLVKRWIEQGARDDTPENVRQRYNEEHPPQYAVPPVVTSLAYSPDGKLIAVSGFHEVLLHKADGTELVARLVGLSERIESARFSPDGKLLVVAGGLPGRMGEIQVWDVGTRELVLSKPVGYDTAYGASWSPDGKYIAFGLPDNTVRAIDASSGDQVLFMGGHSDWVLDTVWSVNGDHLVSVGRDMAAKLTRVETERLIDNITSITPGALRGGLNSVARHPKQDHILVGGSDGVPQIYRMHRETARKISDNANLIRKYPPMKGRIWSVAFAPDGNTFAAVSSLNGTGQINLYKSEYDPTITPELKKLFETARINPGGNNSDPKIEEFHTRGAELVHSVDVDVAVFSVAFSTDGKTVAAASSDGRIHLLNADDGSMRTTFVPVSITSAAELAKVGPKQAEHPVDLKLGKAHRGKDQFPKHGSVRGIEISPKTITLETPNAYSQLLVTATLDSGDSADLTSLVAWSLDEPVATIADRGVIRPHTDGDAILTASYEGLSVTAKVTVSGSNAAYHPDFIRDVNPVISRLGCNAGTCHGAKDGKDGFKLSLRGYDALYDARAFGDDHAARRVNFASPDDSLMLLKSTGAVPHVGGAVTDIGSHYYNTIRTWIADGATVDMTAPRVTSIELFPKNPVIQNIGAKQQMRVVARYDDDSERDVTREAVIESGDRDIAIHDDFGRVSTLRRGEAPVLARYNGAYAATTLTVMGNRGEFVWDEPQIWTEIDGLVSAKWKRMKILPSGLASDAEFLRRVWLDLTGLPPQPEAVMAFLADARSTREKRAAVIDSLIGSPEFVDHWTNKWADMLQVNSKFLGAEGAELFRDWIRTQVDANTPYNEFVYSILTAAGSNKENPAASYYKILRTPEQLAENTTHLFLATRFNCNKCHDHPFERWNVDNYYETAAFFAQIDLKRDSANAPKQNIGGSAVESARPLYEIISDRSEGDVTNIVTGEVAEPAFPFEATLQPVALTAKSTRREDLAVWLTSPTNQYFAKSYANRIWAYLHGTGLIEPIDDIRAGNPPTNPQLLDYLTRSFVNSGFNVRELMREICNSRTYQLSMETHSLNEDDRINYSHAKARRLPAEVLFDSIFVVTGSTPNIPGAKPGMRAAQLADAKFDTAGGFLANLGRPPRESSCECERQNDVSLSGVMTLLNSPAIAEAIGDPDNAIAKLVAKEADDQALIKEIFLRVFSRHPTDEEISLVGTYWSQIDGDHNALIARLAEGESEWVVKKATLEKDRLIAMTRAKGGVADYMPQYERQKAEADAAQKERVAAAEKVLTEFEANELPKKQADWMNGLTIDRFWTTWEPKQPAKASATAGIKLEVNEDASVLASGGPIAVTDYTLSIPVKSETMSGFMLEALTHDSFVGFGPGLNPSGFFVVTEFQVSYSEAANPKKTVKAKLVDARADHNHAEFDVKNAINGNLERNDKAWAAGSKTRRPHWARFKLEKPLTFDDKGGELTVKIVCRYSDGNSPLGRFRIWTTNSPDPLELGLPAQIAGILSQAPALRSNEQDALVTTWFRDQQVDYLAKRFEWVKQARPLPPDGKMQQLEFAVTRAERPVKDDPALIQLRSDVKHSIEQSVNRRLTAAQDLTWALINNAEFLFNH